MKRTAMVIVLAAVVLLAAHDWLRNAAAGGGPCKRLHHAGNRYTVCTFHAPHDRIGLHWRDAEDEPYGSFSALKAGLEGSGKVLSFAMNAGMYDEKLAPVGLYVEDGERLKTANTRDGPGNFHLEPNGVFYIAGGKAGVSETARYLKQKLKPRIATQSGPMLVVGGKLHPKFLKDSTSRKRRNGVGVRDGGKTVVFAISDGFVTFHEFGNLFLEKLKTPNALFLDGTVSSLFSADLKRSDWGRPMGPMLSVTSPKE